jgi:hypothetical protein
MAKENYRITIEKKLVVQAVKVTGNILKVK